ncbi:hypothetical protein Mal52_36190 [Symmachiella dynata]|uniref:DUF4301 domain-containing protein n=2 Tax=Symmachiella dynata TaxID=2527995 RepID=A0A517ZRL9_9PLAN|nr:hypothetical protein Mal52_36190 [Symmachiella dynata]
MDLLMSFTDADQEFWRQYGVSLDEVQRQQAQMVNRPPAPELVRPCTTGDGIEQLPADVHSELIATHRAAVDAGRWLKFVPASGAATRMFAVTSDEDKQRFREALEQFAFADDVQQWFTEQGIDLNDQSSTPHDDVVVNAVISSPGLDFGRLPKGLVKFHQYPDQARTPFEEHLLEAEAGFGAEGKPLKAHFTVGADHVDLFADQLRKFAAARENTPLDVGFSVQHPSTDTIALDDDGELLRDEQGQPVMRPGGHGALVENLHEVQGDLVFIKNIDNVGHAHAQDASVKWMQVLGGYLVRLQAAIHQHLRALETGDAAAVTAAADFVKVTFPNSLQSQTTDQQALRAALIAQLRRPLRVCGMVENVGEPGGGPFWVQKPDGTISAEIVESAEVDGENSEQQAIFGKATHFNPVFIAAAVRDENGKPFDLRNFVDHDRAIITRKRVGEKFATVLERPGLWNGTMSGWNTVFVEVPIDVFSPVKTVFDLLRKEHQPSGDHGGSAKS